MLCLGVGIFVVSWPKLVGFGSNDNLTFRALAVPFCSAPCLMQKPPRKPESQYATLLAQLQTCRCDDLGRYHIWAGQVPSRHFLCRFKESLSPVLRSPRSFLSSNWEGVGHQLPLADRVKVQTPHSVSVSTGLETAAGRGSTCLHPLLVPGGGRGVADVLTPHELSADATSKSEKKKCLPAACLAVGVEGSEPHLVP